MKSCHCSTWMDPEGIMLSEINQTGKENYCITLLICRIKKKKKKTKQMNKHDKQEQSYRYKEQVVARKEYGRGRKEIGEGY